MTRALDSHAAIGRPEAGMTLLEATVTVTLAILACAGLMEALNVNMRHARAMDERQQTQLTLGRVTSFVTEELLASNALGRDGTGAPYVVVTGPVEAPNTILEFRRIDSFVIDGGAGSVTPQYSTPIRYFVDASGQFVRTQSSDTRVLGRGFESCTFELDPDGSIRIDLVSDAFENGTTGAAAPAEGPPPEGPVAEGEEATEPYAAPRSDATRVSFRVYPLNNNE